MRTASCLTLIALGAILAFAVTGHPSFLNIQVAGWVIMLTGFAGMFIPPRRYGWLRRRLVLRRDAGGSLTSRVSEARYPPYVMLNPSGAEMNAPRWPITRGRRARRGLGQSSSDAPTAPDEHPDQAGEPRDSTERPVPDAPAEEIVDEYVQE
jgi:hypothetical protein